MIHSPKPLTITEITDKLGLSLSAVHSLLRSMIDRGYVTHLGQLKGYVLGPAVSNISMNMTNEVLRKTFRKVKKNYIAQFLMSLQRSGFMKHIPIWKFRGKNALFWTLRKAIEKVNGENLVRNSI